MNYSAMATPLPHQMMDPENADARQNSALKKSSLKRQVLRDISNLQEGLEGPRKTKRVNFIVEKPDRPSTLAKNRLRRIPTRSAMQPLTDKENQIIKIIDSLGDVNKVAYFESLQAMFCQPTPILANFQVGVTKDFLKYFWSLKWPKEDLNEDERSYLEDFSKFKVKFVDGEDAPAFDPSEPTLVVLCNPPPNHAYLTTRLNEFVHIDSSHRLMIVGDVSLMLDLGSRPVWSNISLVYYLVTMHDKSRSTLFKELTSHHLAQSAGIPSFVLQLLHDKEVPEGDDPIFFWNFTEDKRVLAVALKLFIFQHTLAPINTDWTYWCINAIDLARSCGCLVADPRVTAIRTPNSSFESLESTLQLQYSSKVVVWPDIMIKEFTKDHPYAVRDLQPKDTEVGWLLLEQITAQNMAKHHKESQTLGERFTFLSTSFIAHIKHEVPAKYEIMPQVKEKAKPVLTMKKFLNKKTVNRKDFWEFTKHVLQPNQPMVCRDKGSTPDWMVKLVDGDKQHLLCIQLKTGEENYTIERVLDELAKSPGVEVKDKDYAYRNVVYQESGEHGIKLTFVFGAISHSHVKSLCVNRKYLAKGSSNHFGALRITHESYKTVPENVEIIVLLEAGLINLLGVDNYAFIKAYDANAVRENRVIKALESDFSAHDENHPDHSAEDVQKMLQSILEQKARNYRDKYDIKLTLTVTPKSASPEHVMADEAPYSPITTSEAENNEPLAIVSAQTNQQSRVRPRENDEENDAEPVQKKQKTEGAVSADDQEKKANDE